MNRQTLVIEYELEEENNSSKRVLSGNLMVTRTCVIIFSNIIGFAFLTMIGISIGIGISKTTSKVYGDSCSKNTDCKNYSSYGLICTNNKCNCVDSAYYLLNNCYAVKNFSSECSQNNQCDQKLGLTCTMRTCNCSDNKAWNGTFCVQLKSFNSTCNSSNECNSKSGLSCLTSSCSCLNGYFWNGITCDPIKKYGESCISNSSCYTNQSLYCSQQGNTPGTCSCLDLWYFDTSQSSCQQKKLTYSQCNLTSECRTDLGLICLNNTCICDTSYYWSSTISNCSLSLSYNESCSSKLLCDSLLSLSCQNNLCQCASNYFWDGIICVSKKSIGGYCLISSQCDSTVNLQCISTNCQCAYDHYWSGTSCLSKLSDGNSCQVTVECQDYNLLKCINGTCQCSSTYYWNSNSLICMSKLSINSSCTQTNMCETYNGLNCIIGLCNCQNTDYWNSTICVTKKTYNETCSASYECNDAAGLSCSNFCSCSTNYFYNGTECIPLREYLESCSLTSECYTAGQLSCQNNVCDCPLPTSQRMYWVPAYKDCRILPKNCKEILQSDPNAQSGIFYLASSVGLLEAYCEMVIDGGGYTFVPWSSLSQSKTMLQDIYSDTSKVLFRLISRTNSMSQPYILTQQLSQYSSIPIGILENSYSGYTKPININIGSFIYIGILPASIANVAGSSQGMLANGNSVTFTNCDGNPNSYIALFANLYPTSTSGYGAGSGVLDTWKSKAIAHPLNTYMPVDYFFFAELHMGGCGGYAQSNRWSDYYGIAFGIK